VSRPTAPGLAEACVPSALPEAPVKEAPERFANAVGLGNA
jgi:hypothetical protein